jgi:hypothetical protein
MAPHRRRRRVLDHEPLGTGLVNFKLLIWSQERPTKICPAIPPPVCNVCLIGSPIPKSSPIQKVFTN